MNILFCDVETTGTEPSENTIIELACRLDVDGKTLANYHAKMFNPTSKTDLGALKVNKSKISELVKARKEVEVALEFCDWLLEIQQKVKGPIYIAGQNVHFDVNFLKAMLARYSVSGFNSVISIRHIDTSGLSLALIEAGKLKIEGTSLSLETIAKALGIDTSKMELHTATADVNLCALVYYKMIELMR